MGDGDDLPGTGRPAAAAAAPTPQPLRRRTSRLAERRPARGRRRHGWPGGPWRDVIFYWVHIWLGYVRPPPLLSLQPCILYYIISYYQILNNAIIILWNQPHTFALRIGPLCLCLSLFAAAAAAVAAALSAAAGAASLIPGMTVPSPAPPHGFNAVPSRRPRADRRCVHGHASAAGAGMGGCVAAGRSCPASTVGGRHGVSE